MLDVACIYAAACDLAMVDGCFWAAISVLGVGMQVQAVAICNWARSRLMQFTVLSNLCLFSQSLPVSSGFDPISATQVALMKIYQRADEEFPSSPEADGLVALMNLQSLRLLASRVRRAGPCHSTAVGPAPVVGDVRGMVASDVKAPLLYPRKLLRLHI